jgi:alkanesulfonate monooxygenase SsuD/methylene tetrahydromethanopterin reductase-like flavin-dependent oxidoreductase (luciferase family)
MSVRVRVGITLPSFVRDPETALAVARMAESTGVDGVFVYDHLFRLARDGARRPALEAAALLGAVAAATSRITIGTLVLRSSLRPSASSAALVATMARLAPGRVAMGIGAGDSESKAENESFGLGFDSIDARVNALADTTRAVRDRGASIWVGGIAQPVRDIAAQEADGWNAWGLSPERFAAWAAQVSAAAVRTPFECSWSGLVVLDETDDVANKRARAQEVGPGTLVGGPRTIAAAFDALGAAGAAWVIVGAVDAADPRTARLLGDAVLPALS